MINDAVRIFMAITALILVSMITSPLHSDIRSDRTSVRVTEARIAESKSLDAKIADKKIDRKTKKTKKG